MVLGDFVLRCKEFLRDDQSSNVLSAVESSDKGDSAQPR